MVTLELEGLMVKRPDHSQLTFWKFCNLRAACRIRISDSGIFLSNTKTPRATLLLEGTDVAKDLLKRAPQIVPNPERRRLFRVGLILAITSIVLGGFLFLGCSEYPKLIAQLIPHQLMDRLGRKVQKFFFELAHLALSSNLA